jgi:hypothetical protein
MQFVVIVILDRWLFPLTAMLRRSIPLAWTRAPSACRVLRIAVFVIVTLDRCDRLFRLTAMLGTTMSNKRCS